VPEHGAGRHAQDLDEAREHVRQRHEQQRPGALARDDLAQPCHGVHGQLGEVAVRELDTLRATRRPGRVDDGRDVGEDGEPTPTGDLRVVDAHARGDQRLDRAVVDDEDLAQVRGVRVHLLDDGGVRRRLDDEERHVGVREDPRHLLGGGRLVEGDRNGADGPDGPVEQRPLVPGAGHDADAVARLDATGHEALRHGDDLGVQLAGGQRDPRPAGLGLVLDDHAVGSPLHPLGEQVVEVARGVDLDEQGAVELVHSGSSDRWRSVTRIRDVRPGQSAAGVVLETASRRRCRPGGRVGDGHVHEYRAQAYSVGRSDRTTAVPAHDA